MSRTPKKRVAARQRKPSESSRPCLLELLEERLVPTVLDLTTAGASGTINGALFAQFEQPGSGSGAISAFVRVSSTAAIEQGYNTDYRPLQFDENSSHSFTRAVQLSAVPTVTASNGTTYYEFLLDINQQSSPPNNLLSVDELRLYVTNASTTDPNKLHNYNASTFTLQDDGGAVYSPVYDLNPSGDINYIKLDANLSSGAGSGDMIALFPAALFGTDTSQYVYLYSKFGVHYANNGGFEQWAGESQLSSISGTKFEDVTGNGFSSDDPVLNSANPDYVPVTVHLYSGSTLLATTTTDANGNYLFAGLGSGTYTVSEDVPNGWFQTGAPSTITLGSGANSTGNNFDNFLVAKLSSDGTTLTARSMPASGGTLSVAQPAANTTTVTFNGIVVGTFVDPSLQTIQVTSYANSSVDTTQVNSVPVTIFDQPGNDTYAAGPSGTTIYLNSAGTNGISVIGGQNTLNFSPSSSAVTFNAGLDHGEQQQLDSSGQDVVAVTGIFQTIVGTNFNDDLTAALPAFNPTTATLAQGTTILAGTGQSKIHGTLGTTAKSSGNGSSYSQQLSTQAVSDLTTAIQQLGASTSGLTSFASSVQMNGGSSLVTASLLTNVTLGGTGNSYTQVLDANSIGVLDQAISSFGSSTGGGTGFGSSTGGGTTFGASGSGTTTFGSTTGGITTFGGVIQLQGTGNTVHGSVLLSVSMSGGSNSYVQTVDASAYQVLQQAISSFGSSTGGGTGFGSSTGGGTTFGASGGGTTTFGGSANGVTTFGGTVTLDGGNNQVQTSLLTSVSMDGGNNLYVQSLNANAVSLLQQAIGSFGGTAGGGTSFGGTASGGTGFGGTGAGNTTFNASTSGFASLGGTIVLDGGHNTAFGSVLLDLSMDGGNNTYVQNVDANAYQVFQQAITGFGGPTGGGTSFGSSTGGGTTFGASGGGNTTFTASASGLASLGGTIVLDGGNNRAQTGLMTSMIMNGGNNLYVQSLTDINDTNGFVVSLLEQAINRFGAGSSGSTTFGSTSGGGTTFTATVNGDMTLGGTVLLDGGHNQAFGSVLLNLGMDGGYNQFVQTVDANATAVLQTAINAFGGTPGGGTTFGSTRGGGTTFGGVITLDGGNNTAQGSLMLSVSMDGGYNLYTGALNSAAASFVIGVVPSSGIAPGALGSLGSAVVMTGGHNTAEAGPLTTAQLSGGEDSFIEQLNATEVGMVSTVLGDYTGAAVTTAAANLGPQASLGAGDDVVVGGLLGTFQAGTGNDRFVIEDPSLLGATGVSGQLLAYGGKFTAGAGPNTFYLVGSTFGHVAIAEPATNSDTLDLSSIQVSGPALDLSTSSEQQVLPGQLWLTLSAPAGFATVVGNGNAATLKAGSRNVTLEGAAPLDDRAANPPAWQGQTQVVFLNFTTYTTGSAHVYTSQEQTAILNQLQVDYTGFDFQFTLVQPSSGPYTTLFFNETPSSGEAGGSSSEIDWRNLNPSDTAAISANGLVGGTGEPPAIDPVTGADNWVALSATIAAHELGHTAGLRHVDSLGPIGFGAHSVAANNVRGGFLPAYPGPLAAWETTQHIIASPASVNSTLFDAVANPFFGEREAIKLAFIEGGTTVPEQTTAAGLPANTTPATAQALTMVGLRVPNTVLRGFDAGKIPSVAAIDVTNAALTRGANNQTVDDYYSFQGRAGDLINIQALSYSVGRITDPVDTTLKIYDAMGNLLTYYTGQASNDDEFESPDAIILDLRLPADGTYTIDVGAFNNTGAGHYELFMYRFQAGNTTPAGGSNDTFIVGPGNDTVIGRGGNDTVEDFGAATYTLANGSLVGSGTATLQNVTNAVLTGRSAGTTFNVSGWTGTATLIGQGGTNTVVLSRAADFTLTDNTLTVSNGGIFHLVNIQDLVLTGGAGGNTLTVALSHAATFTLIDGSLALSNDPNLSLTSISLTNIHNAVLTSGGNGTVFDVRGWTGTDTLNIQGGPNPVVTPRGVAVSTTEGQATPAVTVATFTDAGTPVATNYTANINWGDGGTSTGSFTTSGSTVTAQGGHAYDEGTYTVTTTFSQGAAFSVIVSSTASVADAALTVTGTATTVPQGIPLSNTRLVTFTDADPVATLSDFTGTVTWGDGSSSSALFTQPGGAGTAFVVGGNHAYAVAGSFTVTVAITDVGGQTATATFTVTVAPSVIVLNATASGALTLKGTVNITIGGAVVVDSNSATALSASGNSNVTAASIQVVGGVSASGGAVLSPTPVTGAASVADPLAGLAVPTGGTNQGSVNLTRGSQTINPGIYTQIKVSGTGTSLVMNPGVYIIAGGGFSVANSASVTGSGVLIYNAGSNFPNSGGTFGGISLGSSGTIGLSAATTGTYAGVLIFQSRDNTRALSLNAAAAVGIAGTIYAPAAQLTLGGSSQLRSPAIVNLLTLSGNGGSSLTTDGSDSGASTTAGQLLGGDLYVYVSDPAGYFTADELARLQDAINGLDALLAPYSVTITEVSDSSLANLVVDDGATTACGGFADGVLACFTAGNASGEITFVQGWDWYAGADPTAVTGDQYDFQTVVTHELGHALGLGHSTDPNSVMYATLDTGVARRTMTVQDLNIPDASSGSDGLHAAQPRSEVDPALNRAAASAGNDEVGAYVDSEEASRAVLGGVQILAVAPGRQDIPGATVSAGNSAPSVAAVASTPATTGHVDVLPVGLAPYWMETGAAPAVGRAIQDAGQAFPEDRAIRQGIASRAVWNAPAVSTLPDDRLRPEGQSAIDSPALLEMEQSLAGLIVAALLVAPLQLPGRKESTDLFFAGLELRSKDGGKPG
jgi:hypothetical protein